MVLVAAVGSKPGTPQSIATPQSHASSPLKGSSPARNWLQVQVGVLSEPRHLGDTPEWSNQELMQKILQPETAKGRELFEPIRGINAIYPKVQLGDQFTSLTLM